MGRVAFTSAKRARRSPLEVEFEWACRLDEVGPMRTPQQRRPRVGIDLAPAEQPSAAGTARHVAEQARALRRLHLDWDWVPLTQTRENPLWPEFAEFVPEVGGDRRTSVRSSLWNGAAWRR